MFTRGRIVLLLAVVITAGLVVVQSRHLLDKRHSAENSQTSAKQQAAEQLVGQIAARAKAKAAYGKIPLTFEENVGQTDSNVKFLSRRGGYMTFLTGNEVVFKLPIAPVLSPEAKQMIRPEEAAKGETPNAWADHDGKGGRPAWAGRDDEMVRKGPGRPPWAGSDVEFDNAPMSRSAVLRMQLVDAKADAAVTGVKKMSGVVNYYGPDPKTWRESIPLYAGVRYEEIYPGVDLIYYGNAQLMEYDFVVAAGADPDAIALRYEGADKVELNAQGDLVLNVAGQKLIQHKPFTYQGDNASPREIESRYVLEGTQVSFEVGAYDQTQPLFIDPKFQYSTYLGGSGADLALGVDVDSSGNAYVAGKTASTDFPTKNPAQGSNQTTTPGFEQDNEAFITKLNASGTDLIYSTYLGGEDDDRATAIAVDSSRRAHVTGWTASGKPPGNLTPVFPTTSDAFQDQFNGPTGGCVLNSGECFDAFYTMLDAEGHIEYSTLFGGPGEERGLGIDVTPGGIAFITGFTKSFDFPSTENAFQRSVTDPDETQANTGGSNVDPPPDVFVVKFDPSKEGNASRPAATVFGGGNVDRGYAIVLDAAGMPFVTGYTASRRRFTETKHFPITTGVYDPSFNTREPAEVPNPNDSSSNNCCDVGTDVFITKLNTDLSKVLISTFLGAADGPPGAKQSTDDGERFDIAQGIARDGAGNIYVTGIWGGCGSSGCDPAIGSQLFPTSDKAYDRTYNGGEGDVFVSKLNPALTRLLYSTYVGGTTEDRGWAIAASGNIAYVTGTIDPRNDALTAEASKFPRKDNFGEPPQGGIDEGEDAFLLVIDTSKGGNDSLRSSSIFGGDSGETNTDNTEGEDTARAIALQGTSVFVVGGSKNTNFPTTDDAYDTSYNGPDQTVNDNAAGDAFVAKINTAVPSTTKLNTEDNKTQLARNAPKAAPVKDAPKGH